MTKRDDFPAGAVLVFGGSGGIGSVICEAFAERGCDVAFTYCRNGARAEELTGRLTNRNVRARAYQVDVTQPDKVERAAADVADHFGRLHSTIFVAGAMPTQDYLSRLPRDAWNEAIDVEVHGFYNVARASLPHLKAGGGGSLVHLGSAGDLAWASRDGLSIVPKAANEALVRGIAREEGRFGIRANSVLIGVIEAGMYLKFAEAGVFDETWVEATRERLALKRLGKAEEVADAVIFLASARASYVTGQRIAVAGGYGL